MPSSAATLLLAALDDDGAIEDTSTAEDAVEEGAADEGVDDESTEDESTEDESTAELTDELTGALLDDLLPPPPLPPQATRPIMQVLSRLVFRLINGILLLGLVIADSLLLC